jgi:hypothetical protein
MGMSLGGLCVKSIADSYLTIVMGPKKNESGVGIMIIYLLQNA